MAVQSMPRRQPLKHITCIVKKPGEAAGIAQIEDDIPTLRAIVGGHVMFRTIGNDGKNRFSIAYHLHRDAKFNVIVDEFAFNGPIALVKIDIDGNRISLEDEQAEWIDYLNKLNKPHAVSDRPEPLRRARPEPIINDRHSIQLIPQGLRDDDGNELTPEQVIERNAERFGLSFEHVSVSNQNVYGAALVVIESSGVSYNIVDESTMLIGIGEEGAPHFLRIIEIFDIATEEGLKAIGGNAAH